MGMIDTGSLGSFFPKTSSHGLGALATGVLGLVTVVAIVKVSASFLTKKVDETAKKSIQSNVKTIPVVPVVSKAELVASLIPKSVAPTAQKKLFHMPKLPFFS